MDLWGIKIGPIIAGLGFFGVAVALGAQELFKNFKELRSNTLQKIKDHSGFDILPRTKTNEKNSELGNFANESLIVKEIDYYFSNSIARSSKTMSDCRSARSNNLKSKTGS